MRVQRKGRRRAVRAQARGGRDAGRKGAAWRCNMYTCAAYAQQVVQATYHDEAALGRRHQLLQLARLGVQRAAKTRV